MKVLPIEYELVSKSVSSRRLADQIHSMTKEAFGEFGNEWEVSSRPADFMVYVLAHELKMLVDSGTIIRADVICDRRNNKFSDMNNGIFHLTIKYVQRNCVNTTSLEYTITVGKS